MAAKCAKCGDGPGFDSEEDEGMVWVNFIDEFKTGTLCSSCNDQWTFFILKDKTYLEYQVLDKKFDVFCTTGSIPFSKKALKSDQEKELVDMQIKHNNLVFELYKKVEAWLN